MSHSAKTLHYFHHRHHGGRLELAAHKIWRVQIGSADNREILAFAIEHHERILQARFQAAGSVALLAAAEFICEWMEKKTMADLRALTPGIILTALELPASQIHVANLIMMAVRQLEQVVSS